MSFLDFMILNTAQTYDFEYTSLHANQKSYRNLSGAGGEVQSQLAYQPQQPSKASQLQGMMAHHGLYSHRAWIFLQGFLNPDDVYNFQLFFRNVVENPSANTKSLPGLYSASRQMCVCHLEVSGRHCKGPFGNVRMLFVPVNMGFPH